jgi:hypothetical protein
MSGRAALRGLWASTACAAALLGLASSAGGGIRDDTAWLQTKLDAGGAILKSRLSLVVDSAGNDVGGNEAP